VFDKEIDEGLFNPLEIITEFEDALILILPDVEIKLIEDPTFTFNPFPPVILVRPFVVSIKVEVKKEELYKTFKVSCTCKFLFIFTPPETSKEPTEFTPVEFSVEYIITLSETDNLPNPYNDVSDPDKILKSPSKIVDNGKLILFF